MKRFVLGVIYPSSDQLSQGSARFFCKGIGISYFRIWERCGFWCKYLTFPRKQWEAQVSEWRQLCSNECLFTKPGGDGSDLRTVAYWPPVPITNTGDWFPSGQCVWRWINYAARNLHSILGGEGVFCICWMQKSHLPPEGEPASGEVQTEGGRGEVQ